ncbi:histidine ammonia-lyase [Duganella sp. SG902]|uniref:HAL/PAL/TAL family ammonia-lyase n=1 Tax=Duganella sp. SG902 TaxID=2587016 RepID=UPI00159E021B|nr:histidine ammonia-lyase [Duganella sp. SG902]NVM77326.1 histidine ammonia-lyase [Duganella sp. SG902]
MQTATVVLDELAPAGYQDVARVAHGARFELSPAVWQRIGAARRIVDAIVADGVKAYGINTGLGALSEVVLSGEQLGQLSRRTLQSHACGLGATLDVAETRAIMCAQIINYSRGHSGISAPVVRQLLDFLNLGLTPVVPMQGSVGYLTHMAHVGLALIGLGEVRMHGRILPASEALAAAGLAPVALGAKDGLSLVNGLPCMTGLLSLALEQARRLACWADLIGAMSFEALRGQLSAFDEEAMLQKPYPGQLRVAANLRALLDGSEVLRCGQGIRTQDALSLRSMPQIHGAAREQIAHAERLIQIELQSANDNPLVFGDEHNYRVISQANPHGEAMAMAATTLSVAVAELGGVSERRIDRLVNPHVSGLPPFLIAESGVNSGLMIVQYAAASLVAENKMLAQPMVLDNYITSALQEDHLSLGTPATLHLLRILNNVQKVLAIEYITAAQGLHFHPGMELGRGTRLALDHLRTKVAPLLEDRIVAHDIMLADCLLADRAQLPRFEAALGRTL